MSIDQLHPQVQEMVQLVTQQGHLTLTRATVDDPRIHQMIDTYYGGAALVISGASVGVKTSQTTITGSASFLNVANLPVTMIIQELAEGVDLTLTYRLPTTWTFSQSFPKLPTTWMPTPDPFLAGAKSQSLLSLLTYTNACFVVSTSPTIAQDYQIQLSAGLNFVCHLKLNGILGTIEQMLHIPDPLTLSGPIILPSPLPSTSTIVPPAWPPTRQTTPLPGINLKADVHLDLAAGPVKLTDLFLRIYSPIDYNMPANLTYAPGIYLGGDIQIADQVSVEIVAERLQSNDDLMIFTGTFDGLKLPSLSQMANLVGADDLLSSLMPPDPIPSFYTKGNLVSIDSLWLCLTFSPFSIQAIGLGIGLDELVWKPVDGVEIDHLAAQFWIDYPLNPQRALNTWLAGTLTLETIPLSVTATVPDFTITTQITQVSALPLKKLLSSFGPDFPEFGDLTVDMFSLQIQPGQKSFSVQTMLANQPQPWKIDLGSETLELSNMRLLLDYAKGSGYSGSVSGSLAMAGVQLDTSYQYPGALMLRGRLPSLSLKELVTHLCGNDIAWPSGFDIDLTESSFLIQERPDCFALMVGAQIDHVGTLALEISRNAGTWGFATGVEVEEQWKCSSISPALAVFDNTFRFNKMLLVVSSIQSPSFSFPDMGAFNTPTTTTSKVALPAATQGIVKGCNFFAEMEFGGDKGLALMRNMLHLDQATLDIMLQIGENPTNSTLSASMNGHINSTTAFSGALRVVLQGEELALSMVGNVGVTVQNNPLTFTGEIDIVETGAYFAATMQGSWVNAFDIESLTLSDLAMEMGVDWEGVPTLGLAGTVSMAGRQGSVAVLFDSEMPEKSMLAGSISDLMLLDVHQTCMDASVHLPPEIEPLLGQIALLGLPIFTLPVSLSADLDKATVSPALAQAFTSQGKITLPTDAKQVQLVVGKAGEQWYLLDKTTLSHYTIAKQGDHLQVSLEVQLALVPDMTRIGQLTFPQGFRLSGNAKFLAIDASINVNINRRNGLAVDGSLQPIDLGEVFKLTGHGGQGGPLVSLATYDAPSSSYRGPHCVVSGAVTLLGCTRDLDLVVTKDSVSLSMTEKLFNAFQASLTAQCSISHFRQADFAIEATMDADLFDFLETKGTAAITQAANAAHSDISQAQAKVSDAQKQVDSLSAQIAAKTAEVQAERQKAQNSLNNAQGDVNKIQGNIDSLQHQIDGLNHDIDDLKYDMSHHPWNAASDGPKIAAKEAEIAGLQVTKGSEQAALAVATKTLQTCKQAVQVTPVEADPRVASLYAARETAKVALQAATSTLSGVQQASGSLASVAEWVVQQGNDHLIMVTHASFAGQLSAVSGGQVEMSIDLYVMGHPYHFSQSFDFHDLERSATNFAEQVKRLITGGGSTSAATTNANISVPTVSANTPAPANGPQQKATTALKEADSLWSDADGWNQPQYYSTIRGIDLDGDQCREIVAHGNGLIVGAKWDASTQQWGLLPSGIQCPDADGWNQIQCYRTIQCADLDGDGQEEVLGRDSQGIAVWKCDKSTYQWTTLTRGPGLSDANGWNQPQYYTTIRCADVDGDGQAELLARGGGGISVWKCDKATHQWTTLPDGPAISDANGWNQPQYYTTIQCADVDGDGQAELLARGSGGISVWKCDKTTLQWVALPTGPAISDKDGWNQPQYYSTIRCADFDGDGQAELLARGSGGISVWKCDKTTLQWVALPTGPAISDKDGWNQPQYYSTIQCADLDGDGQAELLARGSGGISIWKCDKATHQWTTCPNGPAWSDAENWNQPQYYSTIQCVALGGSRQQHIVARGSAGMRVWQYK